MKGIVKVILYCTTIVFVLSFSSVLFAEEAKDDGIYISANVGYPIAKDADIYDVGSIEYNNGYAGGVAVGIIRERIRLEAEISYQRNEIEEIGISNKKFESWGDLRNLALLFNGYVDLTKIQNALTPYISMGLGVAKVDLNGVVVGSGNSYRVDSYSDTLFAFQVGAGISYDVTKKLKLDLKYRYFQTADLSYGGDEATNKLHNFSLGVRYTF